MKNQFGTALRAQMEKLGLKESQLAEALGYLHATYISKWVSGSKLPSSRNAQQIIQKVSDFFTEQSEKQEDSFFDELKRAYDKDSSYLNFQAYSSGQLAMINDSKQLCQMVKDVLLRTGGSDRREISIMAAFDLFGLFGSEFRYLIRELHDTGVRKVELRLALDPELLSQEEWGRFYTGNILHTIDSLEYVEMSVVALEPGAPQILVIDGLFCAQILWKKDSHFMAVYSLETDMTERFAQIVTQVLENGEKLLDPAKPESLKRTNAQIETYSDQRQWLFFNEPPSILFPDEIMDSLIKRAESKDYMDHLIKMKNIFSKWTCRSQIDLVLYASRLGQYLSDGRISVGNVEQKLTKDQVDSHLRHLAKIMEANPQLRVWLIRDTVQLGEEFRWCPSIFIDTHLLYLETAKNASIDNFHISMDPRMREAFKRFFENMLKQSFCSRITGEELLRYL